MTHEATREIEMGRISDARDVHGDLNCLNGNWERKLIWHAVLSELQQGDTSGCSLGSVVIITKVVFL